MSFLFKRAELTEGHVLDVRVEGHRIAQVGQVLTARTGDHVVDCRGGALLPGLHDHHIHLLAFAAARASVDCSSSLDALPIAPGVDWIRGVGYHESVAGPLDRRVIDAVVPDRPVRVQHRSGALWVLNSVALQRVGSLLDDSPDVERDATGAPTGRLWRFDSRLRAALPAEPPDLQEAVQQLHAYGITGVTDATPDLAPDGIELLRHGAESLGELMLLGAPDEHPAAGPRKLHLRDHDLPAYDQLLDVICRSHAAQRAVAVHCVTRESMVLTLAVLREAGAIAGDRVEHAAIVPRELANEVAELGLTVVTQPSFVRMRGDSYLLEVPAEDRDGLYPFAFLVEHGIPVVASSDAPYGDPDPWRSIRDATERTTSAGHTLGAGERVPAAAALHGYLTSAASPGGPARTVTTGGRADLVLLDRPLSEALRDPAREYVRAVLARGRWVYPRH